MKRGELIDRPVKNQTDNRGYPPGVLRRTGYPAASQCCPTAGGMAFEHAVETLVGGRVQNSEALIIDAILRQQKYTRADLARILDLPEDCAALSDRGELWKYRGGPTSSNAVWMAVAEIARAYGIRVPRAHPDDTEGAVLRYEDGIPRLVEPLVGDEAGLNELWEQLDPHVDSTIGMYSWKIPGRPPGDDTFSHYLPIFPAQMFLDRPGIVGHDPWGLVHPNENRYVRLNPSGADDGEEYLLTREQAMAKGLFSRVLVMRFELDQ